MAEWLTRATRGRCGSRAAAEATRSEAKGKRRNGAQSTRSPAKGVWGQKPHRGFEPSAASSRAQAPQATGEPEGPATAGRAVTELRELDVEAAKRLEQPGAVAEGKRRRGAVHPSLSARYDKPRESGVFRIDPALSQNRPQNEEKHDRQQRAGGHGHEPGNENGADDAQVDGRHAAYQSHTENRTYQRVRG